MAAYFAALDPMTLVRALPGNVAQALSGELWHSVFTLHFVYLTLRI